MFGNSNQDDSSNQMSSFGENESGASSASAPSLPTMGGQNTPFTPQPFNQTSQQQPDETQQTEPSTDTSHMLSDQGTPDSGYPDGISASSTSDLADIKQHALAQLSPLVSHLDQSAEERFRTTMMMIQATDDQSLLKTAYDAAQKIEDDKSRAQALLDVINEINYFTQQNK